MSDVPHRTGMGRRAALLSVVIAVPLVLAVIAAEAFLALRERRPAHLLGSHVVTVFPGENEQTVMNLRRNGTTAYPFVGPQQFAFRKYPRVREGVELFPLAGISRVATEMCNEAGLDNVYQSDEHGFDNPFDVWEGRQASVALIGDSFVHGVCVSPEHQLATLIRNAIPATFNFGVLGAGPLTELGVLREYIAPLKPPIVVWFFYEGNDIEDLAREEESPLERYLDPAYSQHLAAHQPQIDSMLRAYADSVMTGPTVMTPGAADIPEMLTLPRVRKAIGMVAANIPRESAAREYATLERVLESAKSEVSGWGGRIYFVYLPDYHRFDRRVLAYAGYVHNNGEIYRHAMDAANRAGLDVIDVSSVFAADRSPLRYWPRPGSHYGPNGYALVARTVLTGIRHPTQ
jgi:hypothetical protein